MKLLIAAVLLLAVAIQAQQPSPIVIRILRQQHQQDPSGIYSFSFETENGIQVQEEGTVIRPGTNDESTAKQGSFAYTAPDGTPIALSYVADDNGFRASGAHLPTPPPIPAEILASLQEDARSGAQYDEQGFLLNKK
ncbi:endocuticle structural glycoprotein SgAbd-2-like [Thrips palmi]|uniref:Endocuticle structural glycoprotein SgAbd-2-like n=1 Tax=Thrips palmi TaxID=161013 RepID=A0A6P8ZXV5_THRPL|nr:endocuticle structural glycoprotein SgAbd-2-like [Thrips palmi]